jgi:type II secretory pathway pseudopilin PulG
MESMVALMLLAVLGLGLGLAVSKALQNQQQTIAQGLGVVLLREAATQTANQIDVDPVDIGGQDLTVSDDSQPTTVTVTIGEVPIDLEYTPRSFSIQSTDIFSGDGTVRLDL